MSAEHSATNADDGSCILAVQEHGKGYPDARSRLWHGYLERSFGGKVGAMVHVDCLQFQSRHEGLPNTAIVPACF